VRVAGNTTPATAADASDRDAISSRLMRYRNQNGDDWADIIDVLTPHPVARRNAAQLVGEIEPADRP
jgi:hypothetical protein